MLIDHPWANATFLGALPGLALGTMRYPSGTYGNYFNWTCGCTEAPDTTPFNSSTLADFAVALAAAGNPRPIWMLNMLTADLASQLALLHAASAMGLDVGLIEVCH
jgi:hypothetical protein